MPDTITPGKIIQDELHYQGWTIGVLEYKTHIPATDWANIVSGREKINQVVSEGLATAFGTSAQLWLDIQSLYDSKSGICLLR